MAPGFSALRGTALVLLFINGLLAAGLAGAAENRWSRVDSVASGQPETIGGPSNGCLRGGRALAPSGDGFVSIRRHRNRYYGHPETVAFVHELASTVSDRAGGQLIMVGDLAQPRGGRMASSHVSHQNGLDVDIWLSLAESARQAWSDTPEARDPPSMLAPNRLELSERWGSAQRVLVKTAAMHPSVDRILVNPVIKRALCRSEGGAAWLRKLRPWWGHDAHMHVRLKCPSGSPNCKQQAPVPAGSGCGSQLAWWFSDEARSPRGSSSGRVRPKPPEACEVVLRAP